MEHFLSISIIVAVVVLGVILALFCACKLLSPVFPLFRNNKKPEHSGVIAEALVLKLEITGLYVNNQPQVKLQMQVQPDRGRNFIAEVNEVLYDLSALRAGSIVKVKYNPKNFKELILL